MKPASVTKSMASCSNEFKMEVGKDLPVKKYPKGYFHCLDKPLIINTNACFAKFLVSHSTFGP